jgi:hypothetical protein
MSDRDREASILSCMSKCIHYNGVFTNKVCLAGVNYHEQFGTEAGCFKSIPCTSPNADKTCTKAEYPTREVADNKVAEQDALMERIIKANNEAHKHAKAAGLGRGNGGVGKMPCPTGCGGTLQYSVASVNGHMHARCSTDKCVSWME